MSPALPDVLAALHVSAAVAALVLGIAVFASPKGTNRHRFLGGVYAGLLVLLNIAALSLDPEDVFGPFHVLAVLSLATILSALGIMIFTNKSPQIVATHAFLMAWSYAGLVAAGTAQLITQLNVGSTVVWATIITTLLIAGVIVQLRTPRAIARALSPDR